VPGLPIDEFIDNRRGENRGRLLPHPWLIQWLPFSKLKNTL
jgi:hypothetical protein